MKQDISNAEVLAVHWSFPIIIYFSTIMDDGLGRDGEVTQRQVKISCYQDKHAYIILIHSPLNLRPVRETQFLSSKFFSQNPNVAFFFFSQKSKMG